MQDSGGRGGIQGGKKEKEKKQKEGKAKKFHFKQLFRHASQSHV